MKESFQMAGWKALCMELMSNWIRDVKEVNTGDK